MAQTAIGTGFVRLCVDDSLNVLADRCRVVLEGQYLSELDGVVDPDKLYEIVNQRDVDRMFGAGSVLAESIKVAMDCCQGSRVDFYALPREDYGVKAVYEIALDINGDVTAGAAVGCRGRIDLFMGEARYMVSLSVFDGMTIADIRTALIAAVPASLPFTAAPGIAANVITLTAKNGGAQGNDFKIVPQWHGRDASLPCDLNLTITRATAGSGAAPTYTDYESLVGECCICCWAVLTPDTAWQDAAYSYIESTWLCERPQCMTIGYTYNSGTVGQILAEDSNAKYMARLAHCNPDPTKPTEGDALLPYLKVAAYASISCCETTTNPEMSIEGPDFGLLRCVQQPASCFQCFDFDDKAELQAGGFVTTSPVTGGQGMLTRPYIDNDSTNNRFDDEGRTNMTYQDMVSLRLIKATAIALVAELQQYQGLGLFKNNTAVRAGTRGTSPKIMLGRLRAWAKSEVGVLFSEFEDLESQLTVVAEDEALPRCVGDPRRILVQLVYTPPLRIRDIRVGIAPKFRATC